MYTQFFNACVVILWIIAALNQSEKFLLPSALSKCNDSAIVIGHTP